MQHKALPAGSAAMCKGCEVVWLDKQAVQSLPDKASTPGTGPTLASEALKCPQCGAPLANSWDEKCQFCGSALHAPTQVVVLPEPGPKRPGCNGGDGTSPVSRPASRRRPFERRRQSTVVRGTLPWASTGRVGLAVPPLGSAVTITVVMVDSIRKGATERGLGPMRPRDTMLPRARPQTWYVLELGSSASEDGTQRPCPRPEHDFGHVGLVRRQHYGAMRAEGHLGGCP